MEYMRAEYEEYLACIVVDIPACLCLPILLAEGGSLTLTLTLTPTYAS